MAPEENLPTGSQRDRMRAIAHPIRIDIVLALQRLKYARATDLAQEIQQPVNALSYHLRTLARSGVIVEAPEQARDKRDRVWQLAQTEPFEFNSTKAQTQDGAALLALISTQLEHTRQNWQQALQKNSAETPPKYSSLTASELYLTSQEAEELQEKISVLVSSYEKPARDSKDTNRYQLSISLLNVDFA
ncbi:MAG: winged helix-turn-helix domain-containing protein [Rothia sp. (in: high G+C Gram-positive bacteria)]|nr:winged helix-turn-helix domain-containing protein [Rothia sp. (in: high G+C Gram-positive bacteria)]